LSPPASASKAGLWIVPLFAVTAAAVVGVVRIVVV
jgi:cytochrome c-type biogenesis protein CcmH/NrfF